MLAVDDGADAPGLPFAEPHELAWAVVEFVVALVLLLFEAALAWEGSSFTKGLGVSRDGCAGWTWFCDGLCYCFRGFWCFGRKFWFHIFDLV